MANKIEVPEVEILKALTMASDELLIIGKLAQTHPYTATVKYHELINRVYSQAYQSGYRQSELDSITNQKSTNE